MTVDEAIKTICTYTCGEGQALVCKEHGGDYPMTICEVVTWLKKLETTNIYDSSYKTGTCLKTTTERMVDKKLETAINLNMVKELFKTAIDESKDMNEALQFLFNNVYNLGKAEANKSSFISINDVYRLIAGHANYHGDDILAAFTCLTEGKEIKSIPALEDKGYYSVLKWNSMKYSDRPTDTEWKIVQIADDSGDMTFYYVDVGWYFPEADRWIVDNEPRNDIIAWADLTTMSYV